MKIFGTGALVVLALTTALVVAPAFATTTATTSVSSSAPFATPIGNTSTSSIDARTPQGSVFFFVAVNGTFVNVPCVSSALLHVPATHTRMLASQVNFGPPGRDCSVGGFGTGVDSISTTARAGAEWIVHFTRGPDASGNSTGTLEIPAGGSLRMSLTIRSVATCTILIGPQSIRVTYTNASRELTENDRTISFRTTVTSGRADACPNDRRLAELIGTYRLTPQTARDRFQITSTS